MITADFRCEKCKEITEGNVGKEVVCDKCGGPCYRIYGVVPVHFNAKGFYSTRNKEIKKEGDISA